MKYAMKKKEKLSIVKTKIIALYIIAFSIAAVFLVYIGITVISFNGDKPLQPNVIGDTLGGTLSPLIGLVSAVLIYITIGQQIEANRLIQEQFEVEKKVKFEETLFSEIMKDLDVIENEIESFSLLDPIHGELKLNQYFGQFMENWISGHLLDIKMTDKPVIIYIEHSIKFQSLFTKYVELLSLFTKHITKQEAYFFILKNRMSKLSQHFHFGKFLEFKDYKRGRGVWKINDILSNFSITSWELVAIFLEAEAKVYSTVDKETNLSLYQLEIAPFLFNQIDFLKRVREFKSTVDISMKPKGHGFAVQSVSNKEAYWQRVKEARIGLKESIEEMKISGWYSLKDIEEFEKHIRLVHGRS